MAALVSSVPSPIRPRVAACGRIGGLWDRACGSSAGRKPSVAPCRVRPGASWLVHCFSVPAGTRSDMSANLHDGDDLTISPIEPDHAAEVVDVLIRVAAWAESVGPRLWTAEDFPLDVYVAHARAGELFGGFLGGRLISCMLLQTEDPVYWPEASGGEALYLHKLAVDRSAAGRGVGVAMINWACAAAHRLGASFLRLDTLPSGVLPNLYAGLGFEPVDPNPRDFGGQTMVRMQLRLKPTLDLASWGERAISAP